MASKSKSREILYPHSSFIETFHDALIQQSGNSGHINRAMVSGCLDWVRTEVYNYVPYPGLLRKAAAILYSYITFHPFVDGNKRTALMTASFFFFINGHTLFIPDDSADFTLSIAERAGLEPKPTPGEEIERIAAWLRPNVHRPILSSFVYHLIRNSLPPGSDTQALLNHPQWDRYYQTWRIATTERFKKLLGRWPGAHPYNTKTDVAK